MDGSSDGPTKLRPAAMGDAAPVAWDEASGASPDPRSKPSTASTVHDVKVSTNTGGCSDVSAPNFSSIQWQWKHSSGFVTYEPHVNAKLEVAYQRGESKCKVKSGKMGVRPMMIFFSEHREPPSSEINPSTGITEYKEARHFCMVQFDPSSGNPREVQRIGQYTFWMMMTRFLRGFARSWETGKPRKETLAGYQRRRKELNMGDKASMTFGPGAGELNAMPEERANNVFGRIVKNQWFSVFTMFVVLCNAAWIAIETDFNDADTLYDADIEFQVGENIFCAIFTIELIIRFGSFKVWKDAVKDAWFRFDFALVSMMVLETWLMPMFGNAAIDGVSNLSILRLARLVRVTRMTRLVRLVPEMITLLKGIATALRSVFYTVILLLALLFVFGIVFKTLKDMYPGLPDEQFGTLKTSMWTLLIHGIFLDEVAGVLNDIQSQAGDLVAGIFLLFIFIGTFTVLNMLIGFQCEVASRVSQSDKARAEMTFLKNTLLGVLECYDRDGDHHIGREEFALLVQDPEIHDILGRFGTDVHGLMSLTDLLFEEGNASMQNRMSSSKACSDEPARLSFGEFLQTVQRLRGNCNSRVTDIVELREYVRQRMDRLDPEVVKKPKKTYPVPDEHLASPASTAESARPSGVGADTCFEALSAQLADLREGQRTLMEAAGTTQKPFGAPAAMQGQPPWQAFAEQLSEIRAAQTRLDDTVEGLAREVRDLKRPADRDGGSR